MIPFNSSIMIWSSDISAKVTKVLSGCITHNILRITNKDDSSGSGLNIIINDQHLKEIYRALRECQIEK